MLERRTSHFAIPVLVIVVFSVLAAIAATAEADDRISDSKVVRWVEKTVAE